MTLVTNLIYADLEGLVGTSGNGEGGIYTRRSRDGDALVEHPNRVVASWASPHLSLGSHQGNKVAAFRARLLGPVMCLPSTCL